MSCWAGWLDAGSSPILKRSSESERELKNRLLCYLFLMHSTAAVTFLFERIDFLKHKAHIMLSTFGFED